MNDNSYANEKTEPPPYSQSDTGMPPASYYPSVQNYPNSMPMYNQPNPVPMYNQSGVNMNAGVPQPPPNQVVYVTQNTTALGLQSTIPIMPMPVAVILCITNIILPGFGTMIASMCVFCCAQRQQTHSPCSLFCINFWIGWSQLMTIWFFFLGWVWSIAWGVFFISLADYYGKTPPSQETIVTTQQVIAGQPLQNPASTVTVTTVPAANVQYN